MFSCKSRISGENSNFPLKQVENPCWRYTPARHLAAALPSTSVSCKTAVVKPKPKIRHAQSRGCIHEHEFAIRSPIFRSPAILRLHSQSIRWSLLKIHIYRQNITARHLAVVLATTFALNLCHFSNFPPKSMYHCTPSSDNVKSPNRKST